MEDEGIGGDSRVDIPSEHPLGNPWLRTVNSALRELTLAGFGTRTSRVEISWRERTRSNWERHAWRSKRWERKVFGRP